MVAAALERFGRLDVVWANAGFGAARGFEKESPEHWRSMVLTNVLGDGLHDPRDDAGDPRGDGSPGAARARSPAGGRSRARSTPPRSSR